MIVSKHVLTVCFFLAIGSCKTGGDMKTLVFPEQVQCKTVSGSDADRMSSVPQNVQITVLRTPIFKGNKLIMTAALENDGSEFVLVVDPYSGIFPYGGTSPFGISFARSNADIIRYAGPAFAPEPPLPMVITVPTRSKILFKAEIPLDLYEWKGAPEVLLEWAFYYHKEPYPKGTVTVVLPKK